MRHDMDGPYKYQVLFLATIIVFLRISSICLSGIQCLYPSLPLPCPPCGVRESVPGWCQADTGPSCFQSQCEQGSFYNIGNNIMGPGGDFRRSFFLTRSCNCILKWKLYERILPFSSALAMDFHLIGHYPISKISYQCLKLMVTQLPLVTKNYAGPIEFAHGPVEL